MPRPTWLRLRLLPKSRVNSPLTSPVRPPRHPWPRRLRVPYRLTREVLGPRAQAATASRVSREAPVLAREGGLATLLRTVLGHARIDARLCLSLVGLQTCGDFRDLGSAAPSRPSRSSRRSTGRRSDTGVQRRVAAGVKARRRDEVPNSTVLVLGGGSLGNRRFASGHRVVRGRQATPSERADAEDWAVLDVSQRRARGQARRR